MSNDTICALATAAGGALGILRVSGPDAISLTDSIFRSKVKPLAKAATSTIHYGHIVDAADNIVDEVLVSFFKAPHSYTGENSVEIACHGSRYILSKVLELLIAAGCRQAGPGEFTQRAFLNGKMDLAEAEAVADLVASTNQATHRMAMSQLRGNFSSELAQLREQLLHITSLLELELDFSDQDVNFADRKELLDLAQKINRNISALAHSFRAGKAIKQGVPVAIIGQTNVGKSTLLNRLLQDDKAIVSNIHGTTRDIIEDTTEIHDVTFRFIDTAGIRPTKDEIERLGIERSFKALDNASIVLWLIDRQPDTADIAQLKKHIKSQKLLVVLNKIDQAQPEIDLSDLNMDVVFEQISAKQGTNIDKLQEQIFKAADIPEIKENDVIITSARHYEALVRAGESIRRVIQGLQQNLSGDLLSEDLRLCIAQLGDIVGGTISPEETLQTIFSKFCIGK